ncbi:hypothetical protein SteCoe_10554 [Stentor coeruleus]|uniref:Endonuclease/exonuclease/phosphatase domain-containing protein n=1 Tax=Stentor coeruleus TaxID=5963 RepID=A0A1R2CFJ2_9CILI|nr:hypothetical protein SteCoe_10554 [Stentor coeruleus]
MLLGREFVRVSESEPFLTVLHWNILSDQLSGFFPSVEDKYVEWDYRKKYIESEIINSQADIMCLSEVDHYIDFIQPLLHSRGYGSIFKKKKSWHRDGLCIAFKLDKFSFAKQMPVYFPQSNQFALVAKLILGSINITVVSTHLKSGKKYEKYRVAQARYLMKFLEKTEADAIILCGDFNCSPNSPSYNTIVNSSIGLKSAYLNTLEPSSEPKFTTYKMREEIEYSTIDYIFLKNFDVDYVLNLPSLSFIEKTSLPSSTYPSDHLSLVCKIHYRLNYLI